MLRAATSPPRLLTLILLTGLATLSLNMFLPSLPSMAADFRADYALVSLSIAGYMASTAILQLVIGPLSDRFGRRPVMLGALSLFTLASLVCALTSSLWLFLAFRALQAAVIAGWVVSLAVIRDTAPAQKAASLIGIVSMAMAISPMLGPMLGGVLDAAFGWRASFITYLCFGLGLLVLSWLDLGETNTRPSATFAQQFRSYPELLRAARFWGYALCMAFSTGGFYVFLAGAPLVATRVYAMSPALLGFCMGTITAGFMLGSFLSARLAQRYPLTTMMIAGRLVACAGLLGGLGLFAAGGAHAGLLFGSTIFVGIGNGLTMPSANAGALSVRPRLAGSAAGLSGALIAAVGAALTPVTGAILGGANSAMALLLIMLAASATGLAAALHVRLADRRLPRVGEAAAGRAGNSGAT